MSVRKNEANKTWYFKGKYKNLKGEWQDYYDSGYKRKKDCEEAEANFLKSIKDEPQQLTLNDIVEIYKQRATSQGEKEPTIYTNLKRYDKHIRSTLGAKKLKSINANTIEIFMSELSEMKKENGQPYKAGTLNGIKLTLSKFLSYAVRLNHLEYNPSRAVPNFKDNKIKESDAELNFWEQDEFNMFIEYVDNKYWFNVFTFFFQTGVRESELFALTWNNVNLAKGVVYIRQSISSKTFQKHFIVTTPKNSRSHRTIILSEQLKSILKDIYQFQRQKDGFNRDYYVFGDVKPLSRSNLARNLDRYIDISGVKRITPHGFRHSHASLLIYKGIDDALIAERLGHTIEELRHTYAHIYSEMRVDLKEKLDRIF